MSTKPTDAQTIAAAKRLYQDEGVIEIDDTATVSRSKDPDVGGAYVQAWVWVPNSDARKESA